MEIDNLNKNKIQGTNPEEGTDSHRLTINRAAEMALVGAVERINEGFQGGKVNRNQIAVWAILRFSDGLTDDDIKEIRADHLDEFSALDAVLRKAKESGKLPPELRAFVQKQLGFEDPPKKKGKKSLPENNINDVI